MPFPWWLLQLATHNQLDGVYQTSQKMTVGHLCKHCTAIPEDIRKRLIFLKDQKSSDGGGKHYWADGASSLGVIETPEGLFFRTTLPPQIPATTSSTTQQQLI
jgi:hypothetical protein